MKLTTLIALIGFSIFFASKAMADSPAPNPDEQRMWDLRNSVDNAYLRYENSTNDVDGKFWQTYRQLLTINVPQIFSLAEKNPRSEPAFAMFSWIFTLRNYEHGPIFTNRLKSLEYLARFHGTNAGVGPMCIFIGHNWSWHWQDKPVIDFLHAVAENNSIRTNRGEAAFALGCVNAEKADELATFAAWGKAPFFNPMLQQGNWSHLAEWGSSQPAAEEAERAFREVIADYADMPVLKERATKELQALLNLSEGRTAPEIESEDVNGAPLKLSDSRGKVTVLSFWETHCDPCMQMVPAEKALVERLKGRPFALLGINDDPTPSMAANTMERESMTWPTFWDGTNGSRNPISSNWNIDGWPTVYILDAHGVLRYRMDGYGNLTSNLLNGCVDELMKELPASAQ
jgi:thiol-disulfide isomerase/thioredoxin